MLLFGQHLRICVCFLLHWNELHLLPLWLPCGCWSLEGGTQCGLTDVSSAVLLCTDSCLQAQLQQLPPQHSNSPQNKHTHRLKLLYAHLVIGEQLMHLQTIYFIMHLRLNQFCLLECHRCLSPCQIKGPQDHMWGLHSPFQHMWHHNSVT